MRAPPMFDPLAVIPAKAGMQCLYCKRMPE
jgi:hypothetical protein